MVPLRPKRPPQHPVHEHPQAGFLPQREHQVSHPYKTSKLIFLYILIYTSTYQEIDNIMPEKVIRLVQTLTFPNCSLLDRCPILISGGPKNILTGFSCSYSVPPDKCQHSASTRATAAFVHNCSRYFVTNHCPIRPSNTLGFKFQLTRKTNGFLIYLDRTRVHEHTVHRGLHCRLTRYTVRPT
jgi:hypothetical protein